jgi:branched-subunit amino acid ABC-type transport system permease component
MWLWYLELYLVILVAFAAGALVGLAVVRLLVRRTTNSPVPVKRARAGAST